MRVSVLPESEGSFVFFGDGLQEGRVGVFIPRSATGELLGGLDFIDAIKCAVKEINRETKL